MDRFELSEKIRDLLIKEGYKITNDDCESNGLFDIKVGKEIFTIDVR